jgi:hypothetical protein
VVIFHPHTPEEKASAIREAATAPALFAELLEYFKGGLPSDDNLRAYLVRRGFSQGSLTGVIQAFRDTISLIPEGSTVEPEPVSDVQMNDYAVRMNAIAMGEHRTQPVVSQGSRPLEVTLKNGRISVVGDLGNRDEVEGLIRVLTMNKEFLPPKSNDTDVS